MFRQNLKISILTAIAISLGLITADQIQAQKRSIQPGTTRREIEGPYTTNLEAGEFFQLGMRYYAQGNFKKAETFLVEALRFDPSMSIAYHMLANSLLQQDENGSAAVQYQQALRLDPELVDAYNNLGVALYRLGRYEDAIAAYNEALALDPQLGDSFFNLGIVYQESEETKQAILNLQRAKYFYQEEQNLARASQVNIYIQCNIIPQMIGREPAFSEVCPEIFTVTAKGIIR